MKKLFVIMFALLFLLPAQVWSDCAIINENMSLDIPCVDFSGTRFHAELDIYINPMDSDNLYFRLSSADLLSQSISPSAFMDSGLNININCFTLQGVNYTLFLQRYTNTGDTAWFYWKLASIGPVDNNDQNHKPVAESISLKVDYTVPYIEQQLSAHDPDNDTLTYELLSPSTGTGYSSAYINQNGKLYLTQVAAGNTSFTISFRVTDGLLFSDPASVNVEVTYLSDDDKETGRNDVPAEDYSRFSLSTFNSDLFGVVGDQPTTPKSIDLSANFPSPGDQGSQSSCVGWATAYALKSYQEKVEIGWALNTPSHLFSPAFVYNQINGGQDQGSYISEALDLIVNKGAATLDTMPYSDNDYLTRPSSAAFAEALKFKAASWRRVNDTSQMKAALANRKPVVGGISVYQQLMDLSGTNSVYNTSYGNRKGGHAITIVGYDDDKYGGAFKIINSWSKNWGDDGFFWMPYNFASSGILSEAYVLEDAENTENIIPVEPTEPEPDNSLLPNLTVEDWDAEYDSRPRGAGSLTYSVKNIGAGIAYAGADVNLILSENRDITTSDYYVIYETIPFDLKTGARVYRDSDNSISFRFPDQLQSGTYYMALWVDDLDVLEESNENDNISIGNSTLTIQNTLSDLAVNTWYASWDRYGNGALTYEIVNSGVSSTTTTDWYVNLILDSDQVVGNGNEKYLFYEPATFILAPGRILYRRAGENPAYFNIAQTYDGYAINPGVYYMALWVDDMDAEPESNELNNGSYSWGTVSIGGYYGAARSGKQNLRTGSTTDGDSEKSSEGAVDQELVVVDGSGSAYNGKKLPDPTVNLVWKKVEITRMANGGTSMKILEQDTDVAIDDGSEEQGGVQNRTSENSAEKDGPTYFKTISASAKVIFPTTSSTPMP